jgi:hypothetical protein
MNERPSLRYKGYVITPTAHPVDVCIIVGGEVKGVVRQGFDPYFSISRDEGNDTLDRSYSATETLATEDEARARAVEYAKAVIDGRIKDVTPP